ncbi:MAG: FmdE family protein [Halanaeroarchaeum sp.]
MADHPRPGDLTVEYDVDPIAIRDPVAETLGVLEPGDPFVVTYPDTVKSAGHSCPAAAGGFRITKLALDALYPDSHPVRSDVEVLVGGSKDEHPYGVLSRVISYITGAAEEDGFGGLAGGHGDRRDLLHFGDLDSEDPAFVFERTDTGEAVQVTYHLNEVPPLGEAGSLLPKLVDDTASAEERETFHDAWHQRVRTVLADDGLFTVERDPEAAGTR